MHQLKHFAWLAIWCGQRSGREDLWLKTQWHIPSSLGRCERLLCIQIGVFFKHITDGQTLLTKIIYSVYSQFLELCRQCEGYFLSSMINWWIPLSNDVTQIWGRCFWVASHSFVRLPVCAPVCTGVWGAFKHTPNRTLVRAVQSSHVIQLSGV